MDTNELTEKLNLKNTHYANGVFEIISFEDDKQKIVRVKNRYGLCIISIYSLLKGNNATIFSAEDKTLYWINMAKEKYIYNIDFSKTVYKDSYTEMTVTCPIHGDINGTPSELIKSKGCPHCARRDGKSGVRSSTNKFIEKARCVHGLKYKYDKVDYKSNKSPVLIGCDDHGYFPQSPYAHLRGAGCRRCKAWFNKDSWCNVFAKNNKGTLYVIKLESEEEAFVKVGITLFDIKERYRKTDLSMYKVSILYETTSLDRYLIWDVENFVKDRYKMFLYRPLHPFSGSATECFEYSKADDILTYIKSTCHYAFDSYEPYDVVDIKDIKRV